MIALWHVLQPLFEFAGVLLILLFFAWAFVTLGLLADSGYLLQRSGVRLPHLRPGRLRLPAMKRTRPSNQLTHAA